MATRPTLTPSSTTSAVILPSSGNYSNVAAACPYGMYTGSVGFLSGAQTQVAYTYKKLGGDILDIELTEGNIYAAYEESVLEYSYLVNIHQSKNILSDVLGFTTGTFDHKGELKSGDLLSSSLQDSDPKYEKDAGISLKYPRFEFSYAKKIGRSISGEANMNGYDTVFSASFATTSSRQDYDLQSIIYSASVSSDNSGFPYYNRIGKNRIKVRRVFYKTPQAMWRFYGYYGGLNTVGNLQTYGQYADDSQFQIVPVWQNKQQAMSFEDAIYTRNSHYSYELKDNRLRLFPSDTKAGPGTIWLEFSIDNEYDPWEDNKDRGRQNVDGVNNMNTIPFANIPYANINSIGKQWIRRFALALSKEVLGQVRGKFATIPIPGESVTLNADALLSQAKEEQEKLREELKTVLDELTYEKLVEKDAAVVESTNKIQERVPLKIFVG